MYVWKEERDKLNAEGKRVGYGVVTGEPEALEYLSSGTLTLKAGEFLSVLTDGFEHYMDLPEFLALFLEWPEDLESRVKRFTAEQAAKDSDRFAHERTLIMIAA
jgi:hypothetical protein